jgi:hypothetical protein
MDERRVTFTILKLAHEERRIVGWAYVARKADGTLADDSGGETKVNGKRVENATAGDIVDTPEALRALKDSFYEFIGSGAASADNMHVDFEVGKIVGGLFFEPDLTRALSIPDNTLPTGALVVIELPETERGNALLADVKSGRKTQLSAVMQIERVPVDEAEIQHAA